MYSKKILVIYPEEKSTYIAVFHGAEMSFLKNIKHTEAELSGFQKIRDISRLYWKVFYTKMIST